MDAGLLADRRAPDHRGAARVTPSLEQDLTAVYALMAFLVGMIVGGVARR